VTWVLGDPGIGLASVCKQEHSLAKEICIFMFSGKGCSDQTLLIIICVNNLTELITIIEINISILN